MRIRRFRETYNEFESDIYSEESREEMVENGEISDFEEAFMRGYDEA